MTWGRPTPLDCSVNVAMALLPNGSRPPAAPPALLPPPRELQQGDDAKWVFSSSSDQSFDRGPRKGLGVNPIVIDLGEHVDGLCNCIRSSCQIRTGMRALSSVRSRKKRYKGE